MPKDGGRASVRPPFLNEKGYGEMTPGSNDDKRIRSIVILGGGTAGWMTAAMLAKINVPHQFDITLIESEEIGTIGVGEATIPTIHWFNQTVGLDEAEFVRETKATFKLGIEFEGWARPGHRYFHPFGRYGAPNDGPMFYHRWIKAQMEGHADDFEDYSLAAKLARAGKFTEPSPDARSLLSGLGYAYHFDASLYAALLRRRAEAGGVKRVEGKVAKVTQDPQTGFVTHLATERDDDIAGDLFIDCSGLRGLLIEETLNTGFEDWSHWLPCDRALAVPCENAGPPRPFTQSIARDAGWQWRIPLQHRTGNGYVYSSPFISDDEAAATLLAGLEGKVLAEPRLIKFKAGRRRKAWNKNVIAIGLSGGFLEPLESTSIHLIQSGIAKLLSLFPDRACDPYTAEQYNRVFSADMECVKDFLILHYHATSDKTQPLWEYCRNMPLPDSLIYREEQFRRTGRIVLGTDELFREASWFAVLMGQGVLPRDYNPLADTFGADANLRHLAAVKQAIAAAVPHAPTHLDALQRRLSSPPA